MKIETAQITFISDTHFKETPTSEEKERRDLFKNFLRGLPDGSCLFLLGDIFDFYFEFRSVIHSGYFDLFAALYELKARNIDVHFIGGNHDSWTGGFMEDTLDIEIHKEKVLFESQGRKILAVHGDLVIPGDWGYKALKSVIRNPAVVSAARLVHPDLLSAIAGGVSKGSKKIMHKMQAPLAERLAAYAKHAFFEAGNDLFVMGHVHHPTICSSEGRDFVILGDWIEHFSYAVLQNGKLELKTVIDRTPG